MTEKEAEELIAQIKEQIAFEYSIVGMVGSKQVAEIPNIEKIIRRFANKPPKEGYKSPCNNGVCSIVPYATNLHFFMCFTMYDESNTVYTFDFTRIEWEQLRDNINKMLAYLDGKKADTYKDIVQGHQL